MKTLVYIWRNVRRNFMRSSLTILSIGFSLALMTVLYGFMASQETASKDSQLTNRIVVMNIQGFSGEMPISMVDQVSGMKGIVAAVPLSWYGGDYKEERMPFAQFATDPRKAFEVWTEYTIAPDQLKAWQENRQGCVCDRRIAEKRGWKIGERIPLKSSIYPFSLDLELCGTFDSPKNTATMWFHWDYLDQGLRQVNFRRVGQAGTIFARIQAGESTAGVVDSIDTRFGSSEFPTRTQTEAAFLQMFADMLGNVRILIQNIGLAVVFSLGLVTANSMAMSMRERVTEIAVLKAIGFSRMRILFMIMGESSFIAMIGGVLGVVLGCLVLQLMNGVLPQFFPFTVLEFLGPWVLYGIVVAAVLGIASGLVPAVRAAQLSVIDGLRRVG
ncbi:MAG: ABC transporter permease [Planctomycetota bacterium]